ncbi:MAG: lipocalin family protein [Aquaticitalea sp.]
MKKAIAIIIFSILLTSCSLSKQEKTARKTIDGTWTLTNVTYDTPGTFNSTLFDDTTASCFESSQWVFRSNNSTGTYDIINAECPTGVRNIRWSSNELGKNTGNYDFSMKFTDEKKNDVQKNTGYVMALNYLDDNTMKITQTVNFEGKPFKINMNFTRLTQ